MRIILHLIIRIEKNVIREFCEKIPQVKMTYIHRNNDFWSYCSHCSHFAASALQWSLMKHLEEGDPYG
jgi:hypothetical protein